MLSENQPLINSVRLVIRLARFEMMAQRRETMMGLVWMVLWPFLQAGGFLLAFNLIKQRSFDFGDLFLTYGGVLIWTGFSSLIMTSLTILKNNSDMIRYLSFPFHFMILADACVKFLFLAIQIVIASLILIPQYGTGDPLFACINLLVFLVAAAATFLSLSWFVAVVGVVIPDLSVAIGPILTLLLALSPIFMGPTSEMPRALAMLNTINPLAQAVESFYGVLGIKGSAPTFPLGFVLTSLVFVLLMRLSIRKLYQELAKII